MNARAAIGMLILAPGLIGCTPDGPREFYRAALQAKSEHVDSLSRVVDEKSAGENLKTADKMLNNRLKEGKEGLEKARLDESFGKLRRENFDIKKIDADFRARMIDGLRAYVTYCKNIGYTNVRLRREMQRLRMLANLEMLAKAKAQMASNQPVSVSMAADCPKLSDLLRGLEPTPGNDFRFMPVGIARKDLDKLQSDIDPADLDLAVSFNPQNLNVQMAGVDPPPLPRYPEWAIETDNRAKLGLTGLVR